MSYLELLKLASPEAIVLVTALVVLALGLTKSEHTEGGRFAGGRARPRRRHVRGSEIASTRRPLSRHARDLATQFALQGYLPGAGFFHHPARPGRSSGAPSWRISRAHSARDHRAAASRRERGIAHDLYRTRADRALALCHDRVRSERPPFGGSGPEIFSLRQHGERFHALWTQLHLRPNGDDRAGRDRAGARR